MRLAELKGEGLEAADELLDSAAHDLAKYMAMTARNVDPAVAGERELMIGIGAGPGTDGQVLVLHDLLGLGEGPTPRFVKRYGEVGEAMVEAVAGMTPVGHTATRVEVTEPPRLPRIRGPQSDFAAKLTGGNFVRIDGPTIDGPGVDEEDRAAMREYHRMMTKFAGVIGRPMLENVIGERTPPNPQTPRPVATSHR